MRVDDDQQILITIYTKLTIKIIKFLVKLLWKCCCNPIRKSIFALFDGFSIYLGAIIVSIDQLNRNCMSTTFWSSTSTLQHYWETCLSHFNVQNRIGRGRYNSHRSVIKLFIIITQLDRKSRHFYLQYYTKKVFLQSLPMRKIPIFKITSLLADLKWNFYAFDGCTCETISAIISHYSYYHFAAFPSW